MPPPPPLPPSSLLLLPPPLSLSIFFSSLRQHDSSIPLSPTTSLIAFPPSVFSFLSLSLLFSICFLYCSLFTFFSLILVISSFSPSFSLFFSSCLSLFLVFLSLRFLFLHFHPPSSIHILPFSFVIFLFFLFIFLIFPFLSFISFSHFPYFSSLLLFLHSSFLSHSTFLFYYCPILFFPFLSFLVPLSSSYRLSPFYVLI